VVDAPVAAAPVLSSLEAPQDGGPSQQTVTSIY